MAKSALHTKDNRPCRVAEVNFSSTVLEDSELTLRSYVRDSSCEMLL